MLRSRPTRVAREDSQPAHIDHENDRRGIGIMFQPRNRSLTAPSVKPDPNLGVLDCKAQRGGIVTLFQRVKAQRGLAKGRALGDVVAFTQEVSMSLPRMPITATACMKLVAINCRF